jgi:hypothetical protein
VIFHSCRAWGSVWFAKKNRSTQWKLPIVKWKKIIIAWRCVSDNNESYTFFRVRFMVFKATFNNISAIAWSSVYCCLKQEYREKTNDLSQITDKLDHIVLHRVHLAMKGVSTLEVKGSDCTCSYKSNYIANMTTTVQKDPFVSPVKL